MEEKDTSGNYTREDKAELHFSKEGVCRITLTDFPQEEDLERIIEQYVTRVEVGANPLKFIVINISNLVHMGVRTRRVFSEFLVQASKHYGGKVLLVIVGGALSLRQFIKLICRSIGFLERTCFLKTMREAEEWVSDRLTENNELISETTDNP